MTHRVVVLAIDEAVGYDLTIPPLVLGAATGPAEERRYDVVVCGVDAKPVRMTTGFTAVLDHGPEALETADTVIVPGTRSPGPRHEGVLPGDIADAFARIRPGARIMSICTGAFVLGAAGVLDDRPATTHWRFADAFRELYPSVRLDPDVLFVDDGDVLTSAGLGAGVDLCLHVIRTDFGQEAANRAARYCVVPPWREGGQSQFIDRPLPEDGSDGVAPTRAWALRRLHEPLELSAMAEHASMSVRTFSRHFRAETGLSPGAWLIQQRIRLARQLLETTDLPVDQVAEQSGLGSAASLRQHLRTAIGLSPLAYRKTFRPSSA
ncbi:GlxA family transcriptional regulator [Actinokineospora inagensis]|uniref:GlxA family transcriptional regulator n=1 Tax=Actinokineospora inagensis TaxID=103730 RepID=UPI0009FC2172|nr:helix-turn-helix domain-containing protein [Actinokineospora inagensis]